jgi:CRISPR-associated endonuclease/helicase Cas3
MRPARPQTISNQKKNTVMRSKSYARPGQDLADHLRNAAERAAIFAEGFGGEKEALLAGKIHDLGKFRSEFQELLSGQRKAGMDTHHAVYGAALAFDRNWFATAFAVAGHHAGLHDLPRLQGLVDDPGYNAMGRLPELTRHIEAAFGTLPDAPESPAFVHEGNPLVLEFYTRMLFSCLVDADWLDAERHSIGRERQTWQLTDRIDTLIERVARERADKPHKGFVNGLRDRVFDQCREAALLERGFFSLTVPTGGGKTLSSLAFALSHAKISGLERIIVVIPYLSIIEQNAAEYRRILDPDGSGLVVEHHSAVAAEASEDDGNGSDEIARAADNWDAPIIVTTTVQFIESLFASSPARCRKLHNIANALVIMDEVQTLPTHLLNPFLSVLKELQRHYATSFLLMTATQPAFQRSASLSEGFALDEVREIARDIPRLFQSLKRVDFHRPEDLDWPELAQRLAACPQVLCVVNVRKHAAKLWDMVRDLGPVEERESVFHLSSSMCAEHRLNVLGKAGEPEEGSIRYRLKNGLACRLLATQVVEAGVDIDFPVVYRALGPLDAIVQAAGRCNREGLILGSDGHPGRGQVFVFRPSETSLPPGVYTTATAISEEMIGDIVDSEGDDTKLFSRYFKTLYDLSNTDFAKRDQTTIQEDRTEFHFREVSAKAKVITEYGRPVVVPYWIGAQHIHDIRNRQPVPGRPRFDRQDLRRLQRYMVNVQTPNFIFLHKASMVKALLPNLELYVLEPGCYHPHLGLVIDNRPLEDFIL